MFVRDIVIWDTRGNNLLLVLDMQQLLCVLNMQHSYWRNVLVVSLSQVGNQPYCVLRC